jgi:Amt family ammonium transporter
VGQHGKPSVLGIASGAVAGLVAITPASGTVGPAGALVIGLASGVVCFYTPPA